MAKARCCCTALTREIVAAVLHPETVVRRMDDTRVRQAKDITVTGIDSSLQEWRERAVEEVFRRHA